MISISGRIFVQLKVDGKDLPNAPNLVNRITMTEGMGALSPAIELVLNDYSGVLNRELALTDANEILITVGKAPEDANTQSRQYRLFGTKQKSSATGPVVQAIGIYDAPAYFTASARESFETNTSGVLKAVADKCKLTYKGQLGASTQDSQIWLNVCKSRALFVQETVRHGRVDDTSAMMAMLTSLGELRYFNLSDVIETPKEKIKRMFVHNIDQAPSPEHVVYQVRESHDSSSSGLMNTWQNYGSTRVAHSLEGLQEIFDKIDIHTASGFLPINEQVARTVVKSRIDYSPLDCGNNHPNYYKALYQNLRLLALFSEHVSILTVDITDVELLDAVIYRQANADPSEPINKSDIYIVVGKTVMVKGGANYAERIELVRRSLSMKGEAQLAGSDIGANAASASAIPESLIDPTVTPSATSLPQVRGLTATVLAAQNSMAQVKVALPLQTNAVAPVVARLQLVSNAIKTGTTTDILNSINKVLPSMSILQSAAAGVNQVLAATVTPLVNLAAATVKSSEGVRQAVLTNPGGVISTLAASMSATKQQMDVAAVMNKLNQQLKVNPRGLNTTDVGRAAVAQMASAGQTAQAQANAATLTTTKLWNTSISTLSGKPVPAVILPQNVSPIQTTFTNLHAPSALGSPLTLSRQTTALTNTLASKTEDKKQQWIPETALESPAVTDVDLALDALGDDIQNARRREQDMYPTDWTGA